MRWDGGIEELWHIYENGISASQVSQDFDYAVAIAARWLMNWCCVVCHLQRQTWFHVPTPKYLSRFDTTQHKLRRRLTVAQEMWQTLVIIPWWVQISNCATSREQGDISNRLCQLLSRSTPCGEKEKTYKQPRAEHNFISTIRKATS